MCGIAGCYGNASKAQVARMIGQLDHRGPDGNGLTSTPGGVLGHTRLAIIDLQGGRQPMSHRESAICFNGEIYNYRALRERYLRGQTLKTESDTEVILRLYQLYGPAAVQLLEGMFALAILDCNDLFLARDPLGIKPLYLSYDDKRIWFASEIKALLQVSGAAEALPPGTWFHSRLGRGHYHRYYTLGQGWFLPDGFATPEDAYPAIRSVLRAAVYKRLLADVPVGVSLSGGLDSSIIALLAAVENPNLHTFAVGMQGSEDIRAAREVAAWLGTKHHEYLYTQAEMQEVLPEVIYHLESADPALVRSAIPNYFLARLAANEVKVILTGEGADELYAGYEYMQHITEPAALQRELEHTLRELHRTNLQRTDRMFMAFGVEGRVPFLDIESVALALSLPAEWKLSSTGQLSKALLRDAFAADLPPAIVQRPKQKFSSGAGSSTAFVRIAERAIDDSTLKCEQERLDAEWRYRPMHKEALYYLQILRERLPESAFLSQMGLSRSL